MRKINLTGKNGEGKCALVDDDDFEKMNAHKWYLNCKGYAARTTHTSRRHGRVDKTVFMHREINKTKDGMFTDHINRNKLDNRKENLRAATNTQNQLNKGLQKNNVSGIIGVSWHKQNRSWWVRINVKNVQYSCGCYKLLKEAALARKQAENKYYA